MKMNYLLLAGCTATFLFSCVSPKKLREAEASTPSLTVLILKHKANYAIAKAHKKTHLPNLAVKELFTKTR